MLFTHRSPRTPVRAFAQAMFGAILVLATQVFATDAHAGIDMQVKTFTQTPDPVPVEGELTWDIEIENSNTSSAPGATLSVPLPASFNFISVNPAGTTCSFNAGTHTVECAFGTLNGTLQAPPGAPVAVQIKVRPTAIGVYTTTARVGTSGVDGNPANDTEPLNSTVVQSANMTISTFSGAPNPAPGAATVTYTVIAGNLGPFTALDTRLSFTIPVGMTYQSFSGSGWSCTPGAGTLVCSNSGDVTSGASATTLTWLGQVDSAIVGGTLSSIGTVSSTTADSDENNNTSTADVLVAAGTDLAVVKTVSPSPAIGGQPISFTVTVTNNGPQDAATLVLTDPVPANFTGVAASGTGWDCSATSGNNVLCTRPALAVGSAPAITITATAPANALIPVGGTSVTNTANIASATLDSFASNDDGSATFNLQRDGADLTVAFSRDPLPVPTNEDIGSSMTVTNNGPRAASGTIRAIYQLATDEAFQSFTGSNWSCSVPAVPGDTVVCDYGLGLSASGGGSVSSAVNLTTRRSSAGAVSNRVCTGNGGTEPATAPNMAPTEGDIQTANDCTGSGTIQVTTTRADLRLVKMVATPTSGGPGPSATLVTGDDTITYTLTVHNDGTGSASSIRLIDPIPMYSAAYFSRPATTVIATAPAGDSCSGTSTVTCDLSTIASGSSKTVTITVQRPIRNGTWTNNANTYSLDIGDPNRANNNASADVTIAPVTDIELTAKSVSPDPVKAGVETTYVIEIRNNGTAAANNVMVTDTFTVDALSGPFTFISAAASDGGTCGALAPAPTVPSSPAISCDFGTLPAGEVRSMTVKVRPDYMSAPPVGRHMGNRAVVTTSTVQSNLLNDDKDADLEITGAEVDILIVETGLADPVGFDPLVAENRIIYKVDITNYGPSYASGVQFTDTWTGPVGQSLTFLCDLATATASSDCSAPPAQLCSAAGATVTCNIGGLAAVSSGISTTRYLVYKIDSEPASSGTTYLKSAIVTANETETLAGNNNDPESTTARVLADVEVTSKVASVSPVSLNQPFDWTVTVTNNGPGTAANVKVEDIIPAGMALQGTPAPSASVGTCAMVASTVTCDLGSIARLATATITLPVRITTRPGSGTATNTASATTDSIDVVSANDSKDGTVPVVVSSLAGRVFHDRNNDGLYGGTDTPISGVLLTLSGKDAWGNTVSATTNSAVGTGTYLFSNLPPSDVDGYTVSEAQPATYSDGLDSAGGVAIAGSAITDAHAAIALAANTNLTDYDFGEVQTGSIAGLVWHDVSNEGTLGGTESTRIGGVTMTLTGTDDLGAIINTSMMTNGTTGEYAFTGLRPGAYTVTQTEPGTPWLPGFAAACTGVAVAGTPNNAPLSAADFGRTITGIGIDSADAAVSCNFGEVRPGSLAGTVYYDTDGGATKASEPPISGVSIALSGTDYRGNAVNASTNTDSSGNYSFTNLAPGTYALTETQPTDYVDGSVQVGTSGGTAGSSTITAIALISNTNGTGYDFGERSAGISGSVFNDESDEGSRDGGEAGIPSVSIRLTGCGIDRTTTTDSDGRYVFGGLPPCATGYTLVETQPPAFSDGLIHVGSAGGTSSTNVITGIILTGTDYGTSYDFGEHGQVTTDMACSVAPVASKTMREEFDLVFTLTNNGPGAAPSTSLADTLPAGFELRATPASSQGTCVGVAGQPTFSCATGFVMSPGSVTVTARVRATSFPAGGTAANTATVATEGSDGTPGNNGCNSTLAITQATLAGNVYEDTSDDGVKDTGEDPISGATIKLSGTDSYGNTVALTTTTAADGTYKFDSLSPSDATGYTVMEVQPDGRVDGKDALGSTGGTLANDMVSGIVLATSIDAINYNFGEIGQGLSGKVYVDHNNDGVAQPTEQGIGGVTITVTGSDSDGNPVSLSTLTLADGTYLFPGLKPSGPAGYTVTEQQPALWADGKDTAGSGGGTVGADLISVVNLPAGNLLTQYNFGERGAQLCGFVYSDLDNDGIKDTNEVGLPLITLTLTGHDALGNFVTRVTTTNTLTPTAGAPGRYCLKDLPLSDPAGYTITETQPPVLIDGQVTAGDLGGTAGVNVITGVAITTVGIKGDNYNFGETDPNAASLSGFVFLDGNHDRNRNDNNGRGGWTVELIRGTLGDRTTVIATTTSNADGGYSFEGLPAGGGYTVVFRSPDGGYVYGYQPNITLTAGTELTEQNQPLDPSGVVYDVETRLPVAGAVVTIRGPANFDPAEHLVGGAGNVRQITDATGEYKYLLLPGAPAGVYTFAVTVPTGYVQQISTAIPVCTATLNVGALPDPALVQTSDNPPALSAAIHAPNSCPTGSSGLAGGAGGTQYYLNVYLDGNSADLLNNHIPVERTPATDAVIVGKTTPKTDVVIGELVPYSITVTNNRNYVQANLGVIDQLPPGFKYKTGSATIDGVKSEPVSDSRQLTWTDLSLTAGQTLTVKLLMVVGSGVGEAEFVNQAWAISALVDTPVSNVATATVRVTPDPTFDCTDVIGKVFDDKNRDGYQTQGEPGIADVRLATVRGELITTDNEGRFHIACADIPDGDRGSNYILKVDVRTLPTGYRLTTENPGLVRLTRGKLAKLNFGASIHRVVRIDVLNEAFTPGSTDLDPQWRAGIEDVIGQIDDENSVLRIAYGTSTNEDSVLARERVRALGELFRGRFRDLGGRRDLIIETETYFVAGFK